MPQGRRQPGPTLRRCEWGAPPSPDPVPQGHPPAWAHRSCCDPKLARELHSGCSDAFECARPSSRTRFDTARAIPSRRSPRLLPFTRVQPPGTLYGNCWC